MYYNVRSRNRWPKTHPNIWSIIGIMLYFLKIICYIKYDYSRTKNRFLPSQLMSIVIIILIVETIFIFIFCCRKHVKHLNFTLNFTFRLHAVWVLYYCFIWIMFINEIETTSSFKICIILNNMYCSCQRYVLSNIIFRHRERDIASRAIGISW